MKLVSYFIFIFLISGCSIHSNILNSRIHDGHLCWNGTTWKTTSNIHLNVTSSTYDLKSEYKISMFKNMDMIFKVETVHNSKTHSYHLWVIEGANLLSQDDPLPIGYEIDYIDAPALLYQLALAIISFTPAEESSLTSIPQSYEVRHQTIAIKTTTPSASGFFGAPWKAKVDIQRGDDNQIVFNINFHFSDKSKYDSQTSLNGEIFQMGEILPSPIKNTTDISAWHQYKIGSYSKKFKGGTILDYGAQPYKEKFQNIGQLRAID